MTRVEHVDTRTAPRDLLEAMHAYYVAVQTEELPGDPPMPVERRILDWRHWTDNQVAPRWILWDGDEIVAVAVVWADLEQNLQNAFARIHVRLNRRGEGHAKTIAEPVFDWLEAHERTRVDTYVLDGHPEAVLCERMGLKLVYTERRSRLVLADVERSLMQAWVDRATERAGDYHLLSLRSPFPSEHVAPYCDLQFQMNTAPMDDFEFEDEVVTPERWRSVEKTVEAAEKELITMVAVHTPTGAFAGSTTVNYDRLDPSLAWQWETVVHPNHRNKGIGRWLKGANTLHILDDFPDVAWIDTWNAGSNEPMLAINVEMGFAPILITTTWQGSTAEARRRLLGS